MLFAENQLFYKKYVVLQMTVCYIACKTYLLHWLVKYTNIGLYWFLFSTSSEHRIPAFRHIFQPTKDKNEIQID